MKITMTMPITLPLVMRLALMGGRRREERVVNDVFILGSKMDLPDQIKNKIEAIQGYSCYGWRLGGFIPGCSAMVKLNTAGMEDPLALTAVTCS